jgi:hypothetical protein
MEYSAEPVASSYVKACDLVGNHQRYGKWLERAGVRDALMRAVSAIELLELPQGVQQVGLAEPIYKRTTWFGLSSFSVATNKGT